MSLLIRQNCIPQDTCPAVSCSSCAPTDSCIETTYSCAACATVKCVSSAPASSSHSGVSSGAIAAAVILSLLFVAGAVFAFWWYRRRSRSLKAAADARVAKEIAAKSEDVLNRPDPHEKAQAQAQAQAQALAQSSRSTTSVRMFPAHSTTTIDLDPESQSGRSHQQYTPAHNPYAQPIMQQNPFEDSQDSHSIRTTSAETQSTNVIPIALVPPGSVSRVPSTAAATDGSAGAPARPDRSPNLDVDLAAKPSKASLNLEHANVSNDSFPAKSATELAPRPAGDRMSYMTTGTFASDVLSEAPMIVTANKGKVMSVVKPEFIQAPSPTTANHMSLKPPGGPRASRAAPARSPLAQAAFSAADVAVRSSVVDEDENGQEITIRSDPFGDEHTPVGDRRNSDNASVTTGTTFGSPLPSYYGSGSPREDLETGNARPESDWVPREPAQPWAMGNGNGTADNRSSVFTQASSIVAELGSATRVNFGLSSPNVRSPNRMTAARIVDAGDGKLSSLPGPLFEQQQRAFALAKQAQAKGGRRISDSSAVSATADSILESFNFIPPSPISATPPRSPNKPTQSFRTQQLTASEAREGQDVSLPVTPQPPQTPQAHSANTTAGEPPMSPLLPPTRHKNALSTVSQSSAISTGLGEYAFRMGDSPTLADAEEVAEAHPQSVGDKVGADGKQRASLDTLALTSDLSAYPLNFERERQASWNDLMANGKR